ncbi:hypothetical protein D081_1665 [Anaerovibrio sp. JC8]|uniref:hypothetical protein n=1 Tax=Anaerovibrio sp. JC8 TaxID=1240085 RepID=UPI000A0BB666|nr:hypothetical protein [Anaerovibrio sp. JC8]ORT99781.1 hypothetical protein D081_1665 [Anaerovibrio sp. JC8]
MSFFNNEVKIFDGAAGTARQLRRRLHSRNLLNSSAKQGSITWLNSSDDPKMLELSQKLYNLKLD